MDTERHIWMVGPVEGARWHLLADVGGLDEADDPAPIDVVHRLRTKRVFLFDCRPSDGRPEPVQAAGCAALVRHVVPWMLSNDPAGVRRRNLLTVHVLVPELFADAFEDPPPRSTGGNVSGVELARLADDLPELLIAWGTNGAATVTFEHADVADPADQTLISALVATVPPDLVQVVVCTDTDHLPDLLRRVLVTRTARIEVMRPNPSSGLPDASRHG